MIFLPLCFIFKKSRGGFYLLQECANHIVDILYRDITLDREKRAIYQYGAALTLSTVGSVASILLLATLLGNLSWGIVFLTTFISLRLPGGGYHASTYRNCFLTTNGVFLVSFAVSSVLFHVSSVIEITILLASSIVIWFLAPITNPHHPVSKQTFHKNKLIVRGMVIIYTILILFGECFLSLHSLFCIYSASVTAVAAMMILAKL